MGPPSRDIRDNYAMRLSSLVALGLVAVLAASPTAQAPPRAFVFGLDGSYATVDMAALKIGPTNPVWQKTVRGFETVSDLHYAVYGVVDDAAHGRAFLQVGRKQAKYDDGYLVFDLNDERIVGAMGIVGQTDAAIVKPDGTRIFVSYLEPLPSNPAAAIGSRTAVFEGGSFQKLEDREDHLIDASPSSCFVDDRVLYSPHRFVDVVAKTMRRGALTGQPGRPIACRRNRLLLLSLSEQRVATLTVHDVGADRRIVQFDTGATVTGINEEEWRLTNDGRRILRDEIAAAGGDRQRTGRVTIWDADNGRRAGEIAIGASAGTIGGLIGIGQDGARAFYQAGRTVWVLDLVKAAVAGQIDVPFDAIAVIAP